MRHDLIIRNLWPKPEITTNQELNTMPMHDKPWAPNSIHDDPTEKQQHRNHGQRLQQNSPLRDQYLLQQP
jgi:hypothetical protein